MSLRRGKKSDSVKDPGRVMAELQGFVGFVFGGDGAEEGEWRGGFSGGFGAAAVAIGGGEDDEAAEVDEEEEDGDEFGENGA
ncbi:hypothetical protein L1987_50818 [Smallanthus sonchifolius]|uniref:Uncharacterized protein n=1 Tax=Smallanthus sonchifolius TaxID=185202 RepID=A0ACB9EP75_9ASTR|nr:hypothetical protein L1987_50818 [Smallanthus sonchifolius]